MDLEYVTVEQEMFYNARKGSVYGCFRVEDIQYDWAKHKQLWKLKCIYCGMEKETYNGRDYIKGKNKGNCKCQQVRLPKESRPPKIKQPKKKDHELYSRWRGMISRCHREKDKDFQNYGGRGITVCNEWRKSFDSFVEWAYSNGYRRDLTIDRIDNEKGYSPDNCRWIPKGDQNKNKRAIQLYEGLTRPDYCKKYGIDEEMVARRMQNGMSIEEAIMDIIFNEIQTTFNSRCRAHEVRPDTVTRRIKRGMSIEDAMTKDVIIKKTGLIEINGEKKTLKEWCKIYGLSAPAVMYRVKKKGMTYQEAITTPKQQGNPIVKP